MIQIINKKHYIGVFDKDIVLTLAEIIAWGVKSNDPCWAEAYGAELAVDRAIRELEVIIPDAIEIINNILAPIPVYINIDEDYVRLPRRLYELTEYDRVHNLTKFPRKTEESEEFFKGLSILNSGFETDGGNFSFNCKELFSLFEQAISRNAPDLLSDVQEIKREVL
jgi:hypothetical protein